MSVTVRLARFGKKFAPSYKIVATNTRNKRNGKYLEILGYYNPSEKTIKVGFDKQAYQKWVDNGALISTAVKKIVEGNYEYKPYKGKVSKTEPEIEIETPAEVPDETPAESQPETSEKSEEEQPEA